MNDNQSALEIKKCIFLTRTLDVNIQAVSVQVGLWGSEGDVSGLSMLQRPLPSVNTSVHSNGQQGLVFGL